MNAIDIEMQRRRSETNIRSHNARERLLDDEERTKVDETMYSLIL